MLISASLTNRDEKMISRELTGHCCKLKGVVNGTEAALLGNTVAPFYTGNHNLQHVLGTSLASGDHYLLHELARSAVNDY